MPQLMRLTEKSRRVAVLLAGIVALSVGGTGCERKEKVLDIKGPGVDIEVNKTSSGSHEVEVDSSQRTIEIDTNK